MKIKKLIHCFSVLVAGFGLAFFCAYLPQLQAALMQDDLPSAVSYVPPEQEVVEPPVIMGGEHREMPSISLVGLTEEEIKIVLTGQESQNSPDHQ